MAAETFTKFSKTWSKKLDTFTDSVSAKEHVSGSSNLTSSGLTNFISDVRQCPDREKEEERINKELANIRKMFGRQKKRPMDGKQKKKYILKIVYMFMLGYEVDSVSFVYMEAIKMLSSEVFSEKQVGYLAVSVLLNQEHEVIPMVIQSMQNDMESLHQLIKSLPLIAIANIGSEEMADTLVPTVLRMAVAADSSPQIKKRALMAFLALKRKYPHLSPPEGWLPKIISVLKENDLGILHSIVTLCLFLANEDPEEYQGVAPQMIRILNNIIVKTEFQKEYVYYGIPHPWLQMKAFRFLSLYPLPSDPEVRSKLIQIFNLMVKWSKSQDKGPKKKIYYYNALNSVIFEAMRSMILIFSNPLSEINLHVKAGEAAEYGEIEEKADAILASLSSILSDKIANESTEANFQYLTLDTMCLFCSKFTTKKYMLRSHLPTVIKILSFRDISIRRRGLDVLYELCDQENVQNVISALMRFIRNSDEEFKEELVLKIAILSERFAVNLQWYIDVILKLIAEGGEVVPDDIWHRLVHVVTNNSEVQSYAASMSWKALSLPTWNEKTVRVAGYILGEFGHHISCNPGSSPQDQLHCLQSKFGYCDNTTRVLLLNTFVKFASEYPEELGARLSELFDEYGAYYDVELQQRACEYLALNEYEIPELITTVMAEMPFYPKKSETEKQEPVRKKKNPPPEVSQEIAPDFGQDQESQFDRQREMSVVREEVRGIQREFVQEEERGGGENPVLDLSGSGSESEDDEEEEERIIPAPTPVETSDAPAIAPTFLQTTSSIIADWHASGSVFQLLCLRQEGLFFDSPSVQIGLKSQFSHSAGRYMLFYGNRTSIPIESFSVKLDNQPFLACQLKPIDDVLPPGQQIQQLINFVCLEEYALPPNITITFTIPAYSTYQRQTLIHTLRVPLSVTKFVTPKEGLSAAQFIHLWKFATGRVSLEGVQEIGSFIEYCAVFKMRGDKNFNLKEVKNILSNGLHMAIVEGVDNSPNSVAAAGECWTGSNPVSKDVFICLQSNEQMQLYKLTARASTQNLCWGVAIAVMSALGDLETVQEQRG